MATPIIMPRQGQSVESCIITKWHKNKGEKVQPGDLLFSYETDKAAFDEEAKTEGILLDILYAEGDEVPVLSIVAVIGNAGENTESYRALDAEKPSETASAKPDTPSIASAQAVAPEKSNGKKRISPRARLLAKEYGLDPARIQGTGPSGRVIERDVRNMVSSAASIKTHPAESPTVQSVPDFAVTGSDFRLEKISHMRKIIAEAMHSSLQGSAQLTHHMSADARKILELRKKAKAAAEKGSPYNITLNDMVCFAVVRALQKHPGMNAHFLGDTVRIFTRVHLGIAVDTERGLMVPALRNANEYNLQGLSVQLKTLSESCRKGNINPDLLSSTASGFTVTNLGAYGVEIFTPVLNLPQVGILGVNTITYRPGDLGNGIIGFIPVIGLSLTYDHRWIDGAPASSFLREVKDQIENFAETI